MTAKAPDAPSTAVTAADVKAALRSRWPDSECLVIEEAPEDSGRQGRKIDLLIIHQWRSRGLAVEAVEIKVSVSDARSELANAHKADFWWNHSDRFWLATTPEIAKKIADEVPDTWGILTVADSKSRVKRQAPRRPRKDWPWQTTIGVLRASANAGANALIRAEQRGERLGEKRAKDRFERQTGDEHLRKELAKTRDLHKRLSDAVGIDITDWNVDEIGKAVALIYRHMADDYRTKPSVLDQFAGQLRSKADALEAAAQSIADLNPEARDVA